jgi:hypothetical protein
MTKTLRGCEALVDCRFLALSSSTVKRNIDLESQVADLEQELSVWKQAHSVALEAAERESKAHNVQIATLNRQVANLDIFRGVSSSVASLL